MPDKKKIPEADDQFVCAIQPCVNKHEYADGKCTYHYRYGGPAGPVLKEPKKPKPIPRESKKRKEQNKLDRQQNKEILAKNIYCQMKLEGCTRFAQGVQHVEGRTGQKLTDTTKKIPACNSCNLRAETHPLEAKEKNVAKSRLKK